jgi:diguanylate cyclase (GGDEF)-like protein
LFKNTGFIINIYYKTAFIILTTLVALLATVYWTAKELVLTRFEALETQLMQQDLGRLDAALQREIDSLLTINLDWSEWDDTYHYMQDFSDSYVESNIDSSTFYNLKLVSILFLDTHFTVKKQFSYNFETQLMVKQSDSFIRKIINLHSQQHPNNTLAGIVKINQELYLLSSQPILTSDAKGPHRGNLVFIRPFDETLIKSLAQQTFLQVKFLNPNMLPKREDSSKPVTHVNNKQHISTINNGQIIGYSSVNDIAGTQILAAQIIKSRSIFQQGQVLLSSFTNMLALAGLLFAVLVLWLFRQIVLRRLYQLSQRLIAISLDQHSGQRVEVQGYDEIGQVAKATNILLVSLENAFQQRQRDLERQKIQNNLLVGLAKETIIVQGKLKEVSQKVTEAILKGCNVDRASLWLFDDEMNHFICVDHLNKVTFEHGTDLSLPYSYLRQLIAQLRRTGTLKLEDSTQAVETLPVSESLGSKNNAQAQIVVSVKYKGQLHGFIVAENFEPNRSTSIDEEVFLLSICDFVEQTIAAKERIKLEKELWKLASYDNLTEIPNRSYFYRCLESAIEKAKLQQRVMALLFIDLDKFKQINDNFGHAAGDEMLKQVAKRMKLSVRDEDILARMGGDEFTILLTKISAPEDALKVAQKIVKYIANPITYNGKQLFPGCSIGISIYPEHACTSDVLLNLADSAMYSAKTAGRNRVKLYSPDSPTGQ